MLLNAATVFDSKGKPTGGWNVGGGGGGGGGGV